MEFYLRNTTRAEHFKALQALAASGVDVPSVKNAPKIIAPYLWLWNGFCCLSARRVRSGASGQPQPIQVTEIKAYADYHQINEEVRRELFFHVVTKLDDVYMSNYWEKAKNASEKHKRQRR